jgi:hypothetical protein
MPMVHRSSALLALAALCLVFLVPEQASANEMAFRVVALGQGSFCGRSCVQVITGEGEITEETPQQFLSFVSENPEAAQARNVLFLDSPGGNVVGSLKLGKVLRRLGTAVVVARAMPTAGGTGIMAGRCMSACVYAFMGGRKRVVPPESELGIHRMFRRETQRDVVTRTSETTTFYAPDEMVGALAAYSSSMGISPQLVAMAERIAPESLHIVTRAEMLRWRLGTPRF